MELASRFRTNTRYEAARFWDRDRVVADRAARWIRVGNCRFHLGMWLETWHTSNSSFFYLVAAFDRQFALIAGEGVAASNRTYIDFAQ